MDQDSVRIVNGARVTVQRRLKNLSKVYHVEEGV
jgi:hypothetical protein